MAERYAIQVTRTKNGAERTFVLPSLSFSQLRIAREIKVDVAKTLLARERVNSSVAVVNLDRVDESGNYFQIGEEIDVTSIRR